MDNYTTIMNDAVNRIGQILLEKGLSDVDAQAFVNDPKVLMQEAPEMQELKAEMAGPWDHDHKFLYKDKVIHGTAAKTVFKKVFGVNAKFVVTDPVEAARRWRKCPNESTKSKIAKHLWWHMFNVNGIIYSEMEYADERDHQLRCQRQWPHLLKLYKDVSGEEWRESEARF